MNRFLLTFISGLISFFSFSQTKNKTVTDYDMHSIYNEIKNPYKYGLVMIPDDNSRKLDCPFIFRYEESWYMTYIVFDGTDYETWIAKSNNLLDWEKPGRILSFPEDTSRWDRSQKAGYPALQDYKWGGKGHYRGITGDPLIRQIGKIWVMFYFGAFWNKDGRDGAFNRFACSYDLINWTDWKGVNLIEPSETYDSKYAHKPFIVKWYGIVYHFYCAVNDKDQRRKAVSVSKDLGKSILAFAR